MNGYICFKKMIKDKTAKEQIDAINRLFAQQNKANIITSLQATPQQIRKERNNHIHRDNPYRSSSRDNYFSRDLVGHFNYCLRTDDHDFNEGGDHDSYDNYPSGYAEDRADDCSSFELSHKTSEIIRMLESDAVMVFVENLIHTDNVDLFKELYTDTSYQFSGENEQNEQNKLQWNCLRWTGEAILEKNDNAFIKYKNYLLQSCNLPKSYVQDMFSCYEKKYMQEMSSFYEEGIKALEQEIATLEDDLSNYTPPFCLNLLFGDDDDDNSHDNAKAQSDDKSNNIGSSSSVPLPKHGSSS